MLNGMHGFGANKYKQINKCVSRDVNRWPLATKPPCQASGKPSTDDASKKVMTSKMPPSPVQQVDKVLT